MTKFAIAFVLTAISASIFVPVSLAAPAGSIAGSRSSIEMKYDPDHPRLTGFAGRVRSSKAGCERKRRVLILRVGPGVDRTVARGYTNRRGKWQTGFKRLTSGSFYALVQPGRFSSGGRTQNCFGDTSVLVSKGARGTRAEVRPGITGPQWIRMKISKPGPGYKQFSGDIEAPGQCLKGRMIIVRYYDVGFGRMVASDVSRPDGKWNTNSVHQRKPIYYAAAEPKIGADDGVACDGMTSKLLNANIDN